MSSAIGLIVAWAGVGAMLGAGEAPGGRALSAVGWFTLLQLAAAPVVLFWLWRADVIRPRSPGRHRGRDLSGSPWLVWWGAGLIVLFGQALGSAMGMAGAGVNAGTAPDSPKMVVAQLVGYCTALACGFWLLWLLHGSVWGVKAGLSPRVRMRDLCRGGLVALLLMPVLQLVGLGAAIGFEIGTGGKAPELAHEGLKVIRDEPGSLRAIGVMVFAVLLAPPAEEILFRVFVQSGFLRLTNRVWPSVWASSAVFAAAHISAVKEAPHALLVLFVLGACLGIAYERTGRIWVPIAMHAAFNAINTAATLFLATLSP